MVDENIGDFTTICKALLEGAARQNCMSVAQS
jgi:hypothetical protein